MNHFFVGLDLGQTADYTALIVVEQHAESPYLRPSLIIHGDGRTEVPKAAPPRYEVRHIERFTLGTPYTTIVQKVHGLLQQPPLKQATELVVDGSGVGRAIVDLFREQVRATRPVQITGGNTVRQADDGYWHVPKHDLISIVQVLLQQERLKFAAGLPMVNQLVHELQNYRIKITEAANATYNAREGEHDDLVLALALGCWYGNKVGTGTGIFF